MSHLLPASYHVRKIRPSGPTLQHSRTMFELHLLGSPHLRRAGDPETIRLQPKRLALLAYLAVEAMRRPCRRDTLVAVFWPELDGRRARNALSQALHGLRRTLGTSVVCGGGAEEVWVRPDGLWVDVTEFERTLGEGEFDEAVDLYGGPLLQGLHVGAAPAFEDWVSQTRERLRRRAAEALGVLIDRSERAGNAVGAAEGLRRLTELAPGDETVLRHWMRALEQAGDRAGALRAYERFARDLAVELGLTPSPESERLAERLREPGTGGPAVPSIAVLPFADLSREGQLDYFCQGLTEEIIAALAREAGIRVVARTTVFSAGVANQDVRSLANWLHVDGIVEGSVRQSERTLRVTARLVDAETGHPLWSERYDRPWGDALGLQNEIGHAVAITLRDRVGTPARPRRPTPRTRRPEAQDLYLRGLYHRRKRTRAALAEACACFVQCVAEDPEYAEGHAAMAYTHALAGWWLFDVFPPTHAYPIVRSAAARALALDEGLTEAHLALGITRQAFDWDGPGAALAFARALSLDPDNQDALGNYAGHLVLRGRFDDAIATTRKAEALDPGWIMPPTALGLWMLAARRYEQAREQLQRAVELEPGFFMPVMFMGDADRFSGRPTDARARYERAIELLGREPILLGRLASAAAEQGDRATAECLVEELESMAPGRFVLPSIIARVYLSLGHLDAAFVWLERAVSARDTSLAILPSWPGYDGARTDPRYGRLLERVRLWPAPPGAGGPTPHVRPSDPASG